MLFMSLLVGAAVYLAILRGGREPGVAFGFAGEGEDGEDPGLGAAPNAAGPGYVYLRVATTGPSWRERVQGFVGVLVLVCLGAAVLAFAIYQLGHLVNATIKTFLDN